MEELVGVDSVKTLQMFLASIEEALPKSDSVRLIVLRMVSHPGVYSGFDQAKAMILSAGLQEAQLLATLDLFSFGTFEDYTADTSLFLPMSEAAILKLKQLSVMSCVHAACGTSLQDKPLAVSYAVLADALLLDVQKDQDLHTLEHTILACVYGGALRGRLCQRTKSFHIQACESRDVSLAALPQMIQQVEEFRNRLAQAVEDLSSAESAVTKSLDKSADFWRAVAQRQQEAKEDAIKNPVNPSTMAARSGDWEDPMGSGSNSNLGAARRSSATRQSKRSREMVREMYDSWHRC
eukprot:Nitzschia sp. Nitz4//scaffold50_size126154//37293//38174//NITZ4_003677-RA/size126154-processed-gene-0.34-mRNA-1//1//CDS//3329553674//9176//frame0